MLFQIIGSFCSESIRITKKYQILPKLVIQSSFLSFKLQNQNKNQNKMLKVQIFVLLIISCFQIALSSPILYSIDKQVKVDYLQQVAINSEANIIATLRSTLMGVSLTVQFYESNQILNTTTTHIPQDFYISWVMQISGNGKVIALLEFNSQTVLIFHRYQNGSYIQLPKVVTKGFAQNLALSDDGQLLALGDFENLAELYKYDQYSKSYQLYQKFDIVSDIKDPSIFSRTIQQCKISKDKTKLIFEGQLININQNSQTKTAILYNLDLMTGRYTLDQNFYKSNFGTVRDVQMSSDAQTLFIKRNGFPKIFKKQQSGEYTQLQQFKQCWNNGVQNIQISGDGKLAFILCDDPINTTIIYKWDQSLGNYRMVTNIDKTNGEIILIADDGSKIVVADLKQGTISFIGSHCQQGYILNKGECIESQNSSYQTSNNTVLLLATIIPSVVLTICLIVAIVIVVKRYRSSKVSDTSSDDKNKNLTQAEVNEANSTQNQDATVYSIGNPDFIRNQQNGVVKKECD